MLKIQEKLARPFFLILSLPATAMGFALCIQISALSWILQTKYHLNIEEIGLVWAAGPIAGIFGQVIIGIISDKVWLWGGRRKPFILIGGTLAALMLLALPNIDIISNTLGIQGILTVAVLVALILDLSINISFNPTRSIIADVTPQGDRRTKGFTWMQSVSGTFGVLAYLIAVIWDNYVLINVGIALVLVFSLIPPFLIQEPKELSEPEEKPAAKVGFKEILIANLPLSGFMLFGFFGIINKVLLQGSLDAYQTPAVYVSFGITFIVGIWAILQGLPKEQDSLEFRKILLAHSFTWLGVQSMFVYMTPYVTEVLYPNLGDTVWANHISSWLSGRDLSVIGRDETIGNIVSLSFLLLNLIGALLPVFVLEPISEKLGRVKTHMWCIAITALAYTGMVFLGSHEGFLYALMCLAGVGWAATISLAFAIMSERVNQAKMGLYMGIFNLSVVLPQLTSSMGIGKIVNEASDKSILFLICAVSLAISALLWALVRETKNRGTHNS